MVFVSTNTVMGRTILLTLFLSVSYPCTFKKRPTRTLPPLSLLHVTLFIYRATINLVDDTLDDNSITPTNTPQSPPISIPLKTVSNTDIGTLKNYSFMPISAVRSPEQRELSPISGSFDFEGNSEIDSPLTISINRNRSPTNECPLSDLKFEPDPYDSSIVKESSTNELPLTELNLALFTSEQEGGGGVEAVENEVKVGLLAKSIKKLSKQDTLDSQNDDISLEVHWDSDTNENNRNSCSEKLPEKAKKPVKGKEMKERKPPYRSFSDPNILDTDTINETKKILLLEKLNETLLKDNNQRENFTLDSLSPTDAPCIPFSFYPPLDSTPPDLSSSSPASYLQDLHNRVTMCSCMCTRSPSNLLSFFTTPPKRYASSRSYSNPIPDVTDPKISNSDGAKRHRHSIAGQMSYFKMLGFGYGGPLAFKKLAGGSANSLFSTAVISGSSSAPNLRDMITSTASVSGEFCWVSFGFFTWKCATHSKYTAGQKIRSF